MIGLSAQRRGGKYCRLVSVTERDYNVCMKVEGPGKSSSAKGVSRTGAKKGAGGAGFGSLVEAAEETAPQSAVSGAVSISALDALLSLQEAGDSTSDSARKGKKRAEALLDQLDRVRVGLLTGELPQSALRQLAQTIGQHRENVMDPQLADILDEIDLRAQVELAKYGV